MAIPSQNFIADIWYLSEHRVGQCGIGRTSGLDDAFFSPLPLTESYTLGNEGYFYLLRMTDRVVQLDADRVYAQAWNGIYKSTDTGSSWTMAYTFTDAASNANTYKALHIGPYCYVNSGDQYLVGMYQVSGTLQWRGWRLDLSTDAFTQSTNLLGGSNILRGGHIWHENKIFFPRNSNLAQFGIYDPDTMSTTTAVASNFSNSSASNALHFVGEDGELHMLWGDTSGRLQPATYDPSYGWYKYSSFISDPRGNNAGMGFLWNTAGHLIDPESGDSVFIIPTNIGSLSEPVAWAVGHGTAPYTNLSYVSTIVLPAFFQTRDGGGQFESPYNNAPNFMIRVHKDEITNPDTPAIFVMVAHTRASANGHVPFISVFQWRGLDTEMGYVGDMSLPADTYVSLGYGGQGGAPHYQEGENFGVVLAVEPSGRHCKLTYAVSGDGSSVGLRLRYNNPRTGRQGICTLVDGSGSGGTSVSGNRISSVTASGTPYQVDWNMTADDTINSDEGVGLRVEVER